MPAARVSAAALSKTVPGLGHGARPEPVASIVVVSRVRQARRLTERIEVWRKAVAELLRTPQAQPLFELTDEGVLMPWRDAGLGEAEPERRSGGR